MTSYLAVRARIAKELQELEHVVQRCLNIWQQSETSGDDRYVDGVALKPTFVLHRSRTNT